MLYNETSGQQPAQSDPFIGPVHTDRVQLLQRSLVNTEHTLNTVECAAPLLPYWLFCPEIKDEICLYGSCSHT